MMQEPAVIGNSDYKTLHSFLLIQLNKLEISAATPLDLIS